MRYAVQLLTVSLLVALPGCVRPDPTPRFTPAWEKFDPAAVILTGSFPAAESGSLSRAREERIDVVRLEL